MGFGRCVIVVAAAGLLCQAQSFDVASIKPSLAPADSHGMSGPTLGGLYRGQRAAEAIFLLCI